MAKPSWLTVSPMSGSGNGVLQNTGSVHTGRNVRTGTVTVTATGVAQPKTYKVTQEAKPEFISIDNGERLQPPIRQAVHRLITEKPLTATRAHRRNTTGQ